MPNPLNDRTITLLKTCEQQKNPLYFNNDVFLYNEWPDTIDWDLLLFKLKFNQSRSNYFNYIQLLLIAGIVVRDVNLLQNAADHDLHINALHYASWGGNVEEINTLITLGYSIEAETQHQQTALHFAALSGNSLAINELISLGCNKNAKDYSGSPILHYATLSGNVDAINTVFQLGCKINAKTEEENYTALHLAALTGNIETIKTLVTLGCDIQAKSSDGSMLECAAYSGNPEAIKTIVESGWDRRKHINPVEKALHRAASSGEPEAIKAIVELGCDINIKTDSIETALHCAVKSGNPRAVMEIMELGCDIDAKNYRNDTALHDAIRGKNLEIIMLLIKAGCDINAKNILEETALHLASYYGSLQIIEALIAAGAEINARDKDGKTVLHITARNGNYELTKDLIELGCDFNAKTNDGETVLHYAAMGSNCAIITLLIRQYGLKPDEKDNKNNDIQMWAQHWLNRGRNQQAIDFCNNTILTSQLYRNYLSSFVVSTIPYEVAIPDLAGIIGEYAAPCDEQEIIILEASIKRGLEERNEILKPLIGYCDEHIQNAHGARKALNYILDKKELDVYDLEKRLDLMLKNESHQNKPYYDALLLCRLKTAEKTNNPPINTQNINYSFVFETIRVVSAIGILVSAITLVTAAILFNGAALLSAVALAITMGGVSSYGFFGHHDRQQANQEINNLALENMP